jgi:hypothetical protein
VKGVQVEGHPPASSARCLIQSMWAFTLALAPMLAQSLIAFTPTCTSPARADTADGQSHTATPVGRRPDDVCHGPRR